MNARMKEWLDLLAECEREEQKPGYIEILPPLHVETVPLVDLWGRFATPGPISQTEGAWAVSEAA